MGPPAPSHSRVTELPPTATQKEPRPFSATGEQSLPIPGSSCGQMLFEKSTQANRFSSVAVPRKKLQNAWESCGRLEEQFGRSAGEREP